MPDNNFQYQSNDKYPWEYDDQVEIWVADFHVRKAEAKQAAIADGLVADTEEITEVIPPTEEVAEEIDVLFAESIKQREENLAALKAKREFSWILATLILAIFVLAGEIALYDLGDKYFWPLNYLTLSFWLWRFFILIIWLWLSQKKWHFDSTKVYATTVAGFTLGVLVAAIWKIVIIGSIWTWLNLLIEPVWMVLIIALVGSLFTKFILPDKYGRYQG